MNSEEIRKRFLDFFAKRGHAIVSSSSLIPDDPSVLLTTAGMQQFKPYYTGQADPVKDFGSRNTASIQKSFRTSDIDEVGDESHLTFFEMLGNFSFGGYFKKEAIQYAYDFFQELNLPIDYVTVFKGDKTVPPDTESEEIWKKLGITDIRKLDREDNFWGPTGSEGPCGPTTEIYVGGTEIWNIVFNEYYCQPDKTLVPLDQKGVDTGMGLERLAMVVQGKSNIFETDLFTPIIGLLPAHIEDIYKRIIADHIRACTFLLADGVRVSNKGAGYVLRRLIRRMTLYEKRLGFSLSILEDLIEQVITNYQETYPELRAGREEVLQEFRWEQQRFRKLLIGALKRIHELIDEKEKSPQFAKRIREDFGSKSTDYINLISGYEAYKIYETYGIPPELINDELAQRGYGYHKEEFQTAFEEAQKKHQEISRAGREKKFGGHGLLLDTGELKAGDEAELKKVTRLHTATHLLNAALHKVLGEGIEQRGSDITAERTRFDFSFPRKLTPEEIKKIEELVRYAVKKDFPVNYREMDTEEAKRSGALYFYKGNYPGRVKVYTIGDENEIFSRELCGGPHVSRTGEIGKFKILKEESSSAGVRRIRATIQP